MVKIEKAVPNQANIIAGLIMEAMNHDCCRYFAGPHHSLTDFHAFMTKLVAREDTQYSYRNTLVAIDNGRVAGCCVSYDGKLLRELRKAFIEEVLKTFNMDHSDMQDETQAGELYIDSLAVLADYRGQGIATLLLKSTCQKAKEMGLPAGLLVDKGNPKAEQLYRRLGFEYVNDTAWGSHPMRHLQKTM